MPAAERTRPLTGYSEEKSIADRAQMHAPMHDQLGHQVVEVDGQGTVVVDQQGGTSLGYVV